MYGNLAAYENGDDPIPCTQIQFTHTNAVEDTEPLLVVHSYDPEVDNIGYKTILDQLERSEVQARRRRSNQPVRSPRQTNTVQRPHEIPFCQVYSLTITSEEIPKKRPGETIVIPSSYDAGICGGDCGLSLPSAGDLKHNLLIHTLQTTNAFRDRHDYNISRCCAPINYDKLLVVVNPPESDRSAFVRIIPNMQVVQCECLEIVDFSLRK